MEDRLADPRLERAAPAHAVRASDQGLALAALAAILGITAAWWALALWPAGADSPDWLVRTRFVCFGSEPDGLPDAAGWSLLVGQPAGMLGFLFIAWGRTVRAAFRSLARSGWGRFTLVACALLISGGLGAAGSRIGRLLNNGAAGGEAMASESGPALWQRLDRPSPPLDLIDQHGERFDITRLAGQRVLVTFAYAHCETVCPLVVRNTLAARSSVGGDEPVVVVVTLDPWRDTPERLPAMAAQWRLGPRDRVLSGPVVDVERTLAAWDVPIERDERTGEIVHPARVYVVDPTGRLAWATNGDTGVIVRLVQRT